MPTFYNCRLFTFILAKVKPTYAAYSPTSLALLEIRFTPPHLFHRVYVLTVLIHSNIYIHDIKILSINNYNLDTYRLYYRREAPLCA